MTATINQGRARDLLKVCSISLHPLPKPRVLEVQGSWLHALAAFAAAASSCGMPSLRTRVDRMKFDAAKAKKKKCIVSTGSIEACIGSDYRTRK